MTLQSHTWCECDPDGHVRSFIDGTRRPRTPDNTGLEHLHLSRCCKKDSIEFIKIIGAILSMIKMLTAKNHHALLQQVATYPCPLCTYIIQVTCKRPNYVTDKASYMHLRGLHCSNLVVQFAKAPQTSAANTSSFRVDMTDTSAYTTPSAPHMHKTNFSSVHDPHSARA